MTGREKQWGGSLRCGIFQEECLRRNAASVLVLSGVAAEALILPLRMSPIEVEGGVVVDHLLEFIVIKIELERERIIIVFM